MRYASFGRATLVAVGLLVLPLGVRAQVDTWDDDYDAGASKKADTPAEETAPAEEVAPAAETPAVEAPAPAPAAEAPASPAPTPWRDPSKTSPEPVTPTGLVVIGAADTLSEKKAAEIQRVTDKRLAAEPGLYPYDTRPTLLAGGGHTADDRLKTARQTFAQGKSAYEELNLEVAITAFLDSARAYVEAAPALDDMREVSRTFLFLGATYFLSGDRQKTHEAFKRALIVEPRVEPDPTIFSPPLVQAFEGAKWEVGELPAGELTISSRPGSAEAWVDGLYRGITPLTVEGLKQGSHYVVLKRRGHAPAAELAKVSPADPVTLDLSLAPGPSTAIFASYAEAAVREVENPPSKASEPVQRLAGMFQADRLILGRVSTTSEGTILRLAAYHVETGTRLAEDRIDIQAASGPALISFLDAFLAKAARAVEAPPEAVAVGPGSQDITRQWWFWTATGVGAAIIAGTAVAVAAANDDGFTAHQPHDSPVILGLPGRP